MQSRKRPKIPVWPVIVVALLGGHMTLMAYAVVRATSGPKNVIVADYYEKALNWDTAKLARQNAAAQGLKVELVPGPSDGSHRVFALAGAASLSDLRVTGWHLSRARDRDTAVAREGSVALALPNAGFHSFEITAKHNGSDVAFDVTMWLE